MSDEIADVQSDPGELEAAFARDFGEPLNRVLDLSTWRGQQDIQELYDSLDHQVAAAVSQEGRIREAIRDRVFPDVFASRNAPEAAGVWALTPEDVERAQTGTLFPGRVQAATATSFVLDSLQLAVIQAGVCLVRYRGDERTWEHRVLRRDLSGSGMDPVDEALALIHRRNKYGDEGVDQPDRITELGTRGISAYAERAVLARVADAPWRLGSGSPAPFEILSGAGSLDIVGEGLAVLRELILDHRRFVFVQKAPRKRGLLTLGLALRPLEFVIVHHLRTYIEDMVAHGHLRGERREDALGFVEQVGRKVVVGVYRVSETSPPYVFYAPSDPGLCRQAATIAIADAVLQEHIGFPLLLDLAARLAGEALGERSVRAATHAAFHARGCALMSAEGR